MTEAEAREELEMLVQWEEDPPLDALEIDFLLRRSLVADAAGLPPGAEGYVPTWDVRSAAGRGWRLKAGKAAARFDMTADVMGLSRSQVIEHCLQLARAYEGPVVA